MQDLREELEREGRVWLRQAIAPEELTELARVSDMGGRPGARIGATHPLCQLVARLPGLDPVTAAWPGMRAVRLVSFSKDEDRNWSVPWHQDRVIAVKSRAELPGYGNWSRKGEAWHCEPPLDLLSRMLFLRLHLDPNTAENGAMEIALGSHRCGYVPAEEADDLAESCPCEITTAAPGDILILSMLTLHRSRPAKVSASRRVLRMDMSADTLPAPLEWAI